MPKFLTFASGIDVQSELERSLLASLTGNLSPEQLASSFWYNPLSLMRNPTLMSVSSCRPLVFRRIRLLLHRERICQHQNDMLLTSDLTQTAVKALHSILQRRFLLLLRSKFPTCRKSSRTCTLTGTTLHSHGKMSRAQHSWLHGLLIKGHEICVPVNIPAQLLCCLTFQFGNNKFDMFGMSISDQRRRMRFRLSGLCLRTWPLTSLHMLF